MAKKIYTAQTIETYALISKLERQLSDLFGSTYEGVLRMAAVRKAIQAGEPFTFDANRPETKQLINSLSVMAGKANKMLENSVTLAWQEGEESVTNACYTAFGSVKGSKEAVRAIADRSREDLRKHGVSAHSYYNRQHGGLTISDRVWAIAQSGKNEIEEIIQQGVLQGKSAAEISRSVRSFLRNPNKLFRRVRNKETGELELSRNAKNYHPGRGVYRSSCQNAMRLARTEVNAAYRRAEWESYQNNPLITGYRIQLSNNHTIKIKGKAVAFHDICDELAGDYPKTFQWTGWHPQCRCRMVPIFLTEGDFRQRIRALAAGKLDTWKAGNTVTQVPDAFTGWVKANTDRLKAAKQTPFFILDNYKDGDPTKGLVKSITDLQRQVQQCAKVQPVTEYDSELAELEKWSATFELDTKQARILREAGDKAGLKKDIERLQELKDDRTTEWLTARTRLRIFAEKLKDYPEYSKYDSLMQQLVIKPQGPTWKEAVQKLKDAANQARADYDKRLKEKEAEKQRAQAAAAAKKTAKTDLTKDYAKKVDAATTVQEVKQLFGASLKQVLGYDVKLDFSEKTITLDIVKTYAKRYIELCQEYTLEMPCTKVQFKKLSGVYGQVSWLNEEGKRARYVWEIKAKCQNTGPDVAEIRAKEVATGKSRCDKDKLQVSTLTHEFGHNICVEGVNRSANARAFITELKTIRDAYYKEIRGLTKGSKEYNDIYLGDYADTNIDEFLAEGFQEYKNRATPSKYAKQVGELVDKYFKKK